VKPAPEGFKIRINLVEISERGRKRLGKTVDSSSPRSASPFSTSSILPPPLALPIIKYSKLYKLLLCFFYTPARAH